MSQMTSLTWTDLDKQAVRYGRVLAADAVQKPATATPEPQSHLRLQHTCCSKKS